MDDVLDMSDEEVENPFDNDSEDNFVANETDTESSDDNEPQPKRKKLKRENQESSSASIDIDDDPIEEENGEITWRSVTGNYLKNIPYTGENTGVSAEVTMNYLTKLHMIFSNTLLLMI